VKGIPPLVVATCQLWGTGARAPSTSSNLLFRQSCIKSSRTMQASPLIPPHLKHVVTLPCEIGETFLNNSGQLFAFSGHPVSAHQRCHSQQRRIIGYSSS